MRKFYNKLLKSFIFIQDISIGGVYLEEKFNDYVRYFKCCGIGLIGDFSTGAIIGLDEEGSKFIENFINDCTTVPATEKEKEILQQLKISGFFEKKDMALNVAYFHVTSKCNLKCIGCYSDEENRNEKKDLSTSQCYKIIDNLKHANVRCLIISGGEPLLRNDLPEILNYAKTNCKIPIIQVVSNGMIDRHRYEEILPYIDLISISVDGYNENVHFLRNSNMRYVIDTVKYLSSITKKLSMIFTLHGQNLQYIPEYIAFSNSLQVPFSFSLLTVKKEVAFSQFYLEEDAYLLLNSMERKYEIPIEDVTTENVIGCKNSCGLGMQIISISSDGNVYPCHMLHDPDLKMGNALCEEISSILCKYCQQWDVNHIEECKKCEYKYLCGGGCYARRYFNKKNIQNSHDPCCEIYKTDIMQTLFKCINDN